MDLTLNNLQGLICHKTQTKQTNLQFSLQLIEPSAENSEGQGYDVILAQALKSACHQAGVLATPTVLLIPEIFAYNCDLTSISNLLAQGNVDYFL